MNRYAKNIILVMSGGTGSRFGADCPKQYCLMDGRMIIDYVMDISSIMITYYMTGKPIIYCPPDNIEECDTYRKMRPGMYIAHNYQEIEEAVDMLTSGSDPRWRYRLEMINKIKEKSFDATKKIVNWIVGDYEETNI